MGTNKIIGGKVKHLRESKNLTLEEVADRSNISIEELIRIEEDIDLPSLAPLIRIARTLGIRLGTFLDDQKALGPVVCRKSESLMNPGIDFSNNSKEHRKHMEYHSLSQDKSGRHMEPFLIDVAPSNGAEFATSSHEGEEFIYVLEGIVEIDYGKDRFILEAGDSIYYDSIVSHHVHAYNRETAKILGIVYTPY